MKLPEKVPMENHRPSCETKPLWVVGYLRAIFIETQGMVLLEALAAGLPLVAIAAMGAADFMTSEPPCPHCC